MKFSRMEERTKIINDTINRYNGNRIHAFFYENEKVPEIMYSYDESTDSLVAEKVSLCLSNYKNKDFTLHNFYTILCELEKKILEYYKNEKNIILEIDDD